MIETMLSRKDFVRIIGGGTVFYGGDQSWYDKYVQQFGGCASISAANVLAYMAVTKPNMAKLYNYCIDNISKEDFKKHMDEVYKFVTSNEVPLVKDTKKGVHIGKMEIPPSLGIFSLSDFGEKVEKFALSRGIQLKPNWTDAKPTFENIIRYIKEGLNKDCPVALLNMFNPVKMQWTNPVNNKISIQIYKQHWVTVTGIIENEDTGEITVEVSSWGGKGTFSLNEFWDNINWNEAFFPAGFIYFKDNT